MVKACTREQLEKIQMHELDILEEIKRVCEENNISWFTVGGTTLGAIRHEGFIPWDNDIDLGMLREDYDKFMEIAGKQLKKGYVLQHFSTDKNTPTYFAKVRKDGTKFAQYSNKSLKIHHGVFVDIMPYDSVPEDVIQRRKYNKKVKLWHELYKAKMMWVASKPLFTSKRTFFNTCTRFILHTLLLPCPKKVIFSKMEKTIRKYNGTDTNMISSRGIPVFECFKADIFPPREHKFENTSVMVPKDSHRVLTIQYGDYMKLPPEEKRVSHLPYILEL